MLDPEESRGDAADHLLGPNRAQARGATGEARQAADGNILVLGGGTDASKDRQGAG
jgi:hypothetical protein